MRLSEPRVSPLDPGSLTDEQREIAIKASPPESDLLNITKTLVRHPKLLKRWNVFAGHVLTKSSLPAPGARDRDPADRVALPGGVRVGAARRHRAAVRPRRRGLRAHQGGTGRPGLDPPRGRAPPRDGRAPRGTRSSGDETWAALAATWSEEQLMDFIFAVGQYRLVSMALNTLGVQIDPGLRGF